MTKTAGGHLNVNYNMATNKRRKAKKSTSLFACLLLLRRKKKKKASDKRRTTFQHIGVLKAGQRDKICKH